MANLEIKTQGSFVAGGKTITAPGQFEFDDAMGTAGQTRHGDHAYVEYQVPENLNKYPLVFLHGAGQSAAGFQTTPDGREGFNNIFLRKQYPVYLVDQPRRGRAAQNIVKAEIEPVFDDQLWFSNFRIGHWPNVDEDMAFPKSQAAVNNFLHMMVPDIGPYDSGVISDAFTKVFKKSGDSVLVSHSQGVGPGWEVVIKSDHVKGVVAMEPGSGFIFPKGEVPEPIESLSPWGKLPATEVSDEEFTKLTEIPIIIIYGDKVPREPADSWPVDAWRARAEMADHFVAAINRHGGQAELLRLPDLGLKGNTHFMFQDLNNQEVAGVIDNWLKKHNLGGK
ncbi:alpha/beta hydrolase [Lactococcus lactis]|uniref:alpha/beta hydrolase n=1 Tax=Lactococcus lactis TaxID=1358 RepID=UPI00237862A8|nr:alpha/beta fold hydrolase [Lactococcus lactis]WDA70055.1 alpha/beta fold hydrolase [Lactococcus lactis]